MNIICEYCGSNEITQYPKEQKEMCEQCGYIQPITILNQNKDEKN
jgi:transcription initiation factor TFIIIB Brf1 subunit/transcription initiation factor TFIIB